MPIKYEYSSTCCKHYYIEIRGENDPMVHPVCNNCGQGEYELIQQTTLEV